MSSTHLPANLAHLARLGLCSLALTQLAFGATLASAAQQPTTTTPIKHAIVIIGENRNFEFPRGNLGATNEPSA